MTIASATSRVNYVGDGATTAFSIPFYFQANADLKVYLQSSTGTQTLQTLGTHYTLTGAGVEAGGTCTFVTAPTATTGAVISIYRDPPVTQTTSYNNNDPFPAASHENALDKVTMLEQRTRDLITRTMQQPEADATLDMHLPSSVDRANKLLGFDDDGLPTPVLGPSYVGGTDIGSAIVSTRAVAAVTTFDADIIYLITGGKTLVGDGGAATYKRGTGTGSFTDGGAVTWVPVSSDTAVFSTRAVAELDTIDLSILYLVTGGLATIGDGSNARYKRAGGSTSEGFQSADGSWWEKILETSSVIGKPITGLLISNNAGTPNTILDIAPGSARDETQAVDIVLAAGVTKTTAAFVAGTGNGSLDSGAIAINSAYHVFVIYNDTTLAVDILTSLSATAPTMPSGFTHKRRLRSGFITDGSGFIRQGVWRADGSFALKPSHTVTIATNRSLLNSSLLALGLPAGIKFKARCLLTITNAVDVGSPGFYGFFNDPDLGAPSTASEAAIFKPLGIVFTGAVVEAWTDTTGKVYTGSASANDADNLMNVILQGWTDPLDPFS
jgi:hypothetical protein